MHALSPLQTWSGFFFLANDISVACRFSKRMTLVLAALDHPGFWINGYAFPVAPVTIPGVATLDGVTHTTEGAQGRRRKAWLHVNNIGEVLLVKTRSVHRPLNIQTSVRSAQVTIGNGRDDA